MIVSFHLKVNVTGHEGDGFARITLSDDEVKSDANLLDIRIDGTSIPNFKEDTYYYEIELDETEFFDKEITVLKKHTGQVIDGDGNVEIKYGSKNHIIRVYAADKKTKRDYVINFIRKPSTKLYSLSFNDYIFKNNVEFNPDYYNYELDVFQYTEIIPEYIAYDQNAEIEIEGLDSLKKGKNTVLVKVSNGELKPSVYTITFNINYSIDFNFENQEQKFVVPHTGKYKLDVWGAQGGQRSEEVPGGKGGFSSGVVELTKGEVIYINVGEQRRC